MKKKKIKILQLELNHLKFHDDEDYYKKRLDEFKEVNKNIIKKKKNIISFQRDRLNKKKENSEIKVKKYEALINEEIDYKKNLLRNYSNSNINFKNNLMSKYINIKTVNI